MSILEKYKEIFSIVGSIISIFSLFFFIPALTGLYYSETLWKLFFILGIINFSFGIFLFVSCKRIILHSSKSRELQPRDGFLLVILVWISLSSIASLPFYFYDSNIHPIKAFFEAVSGLTTTGATIFSGLDEMPKAVLIWRAVLQWLGGMGILVLTIAILPMLGVGGMQIFRAEVSGPMKDKKFTPRIAETAKALWTIYITLTIFCALFYWFAGMSGFDAIAHSFTTVSIGGLSTHDTSFNFFQNPTVEFIAIIFMLIAGMNFTLHFAAIRNLSLKSYFKSLENKCFLSVILISVLVVFYSLLSTNSSDDYFNLIRMSLFNVVSIATTTGYATEDYNQWPTIAFTLMILLSCFTSCSGSTGGGVKMIRIIIMLKQARRELFRTIHPHAVIPIKIGESTVGNRVVLAVLAFMFFYLLTLLITFLTLTATGLSGGASISAALACLNNLGPALFELGPTSNYGSLNNVQLLVLSIAMLLGRLELLTIFVFFSNAFWKS